jgi:hypothetical protein
MSKLLKVNASYIDIFTVGYYKLVVYPFALIFGSPYFDTQLQMVTFSENRYIQIKEIEFTDWFKVFEQILDIITKDNISEQQNTIITANSLFSSESDDLTNFQNCCFYNIKTVDNLKCFTIISRYEQTLEISLDIVEMVQLIVGFRSLFFKIYSYHPNQFFLIKTFISTTSTDFLIESNEITIYQKMSTNPVIVLNSAEIFVLSELIVRHRDALISWKKLMELSL